MSLEYNLKQFKPQNIKESDKYSINLYKVLAKLQKETKQYTNPFTVYFLHHSRFDGEYLEFNSNKSVPMRQIVISPYGSKRYGYMLDSIFHKGTRSEMFALPYRDDELTDITDWFFKNYQRFGRCIFDQEHIGWWTGGENRYTKINNHSKRCNWCGIYLEREIIKEIKINKRETWKPILKLK